VNLKILIVDVEVNADQDSFEEAVHRVNTAIHDLDLEIRKALSQKTGEPIWALVTLLPNQLTLG
jgi:Nse1 non-SMC component of SMC5-6 complex